MAEACCEQRIKVTVTSCISDRHTLYEIHGLLILLNFQGKTETITGRKLNATEEFMRGCHL
jgi:hypothetical protein